MLEFNIVPVDGGWFEFPETVRDCSIYQPLDYPSEIIPGTEVCCIKVEGCEILFSHEMHGIHVIFKAETVPFEHAKAIIESVSRHIAQITGQEAAVF